MWGKFDMAKYKKKCDNVLKNDKKGPRIGRLGKPGPWAETKTPGRSTGAQTIFFSEVTGRKKKLAIGAP